MTFAPVGLRCPDHAGKPRSGPPKAVRTVQRPLARRGIVVHSDGIVTRILVGLNVLVYLITVAQGSGLNSPGGSLFDSWALFGGRAILDGHIYDGVAQGAWWRLLTAAFLHAGLLHIAFNMYALWWLGAVVENALGSVRFLLLYIVSGLAGSAGALIWSTGITVGASGAIFGILGAGLILEWRASGRLLGGFATMILINLAISFGLYNVISVGGHIGGLIAGILATGLMVVRGRFRSTWDVPTLLGIAAIGVASVVIAYLKVRGMA